MVTDASVEIIRKNGHENLNARTIAEYLNCSTQPVMYNYKTVDEIREAAYVVADAYHTAFIMPKETDSNPMLALGLNYVRYSKKYGTSEIWLLYPMNQEMSNHAEISFESVDGVNVRLCFVDVANIERSLQGLRERLIG